MTIMKEVIKAKSVQSGNPFKSVIQTISKGHNGHLEVETEETGRSKFLIKMPLT